MPAIKRQIQRTCALYSILRTSTRPPTKNQIIEKLDEKLNIKVCVSSIEKDIYRLRTDFGITIRCNRFTKGYYIPNANKSMDKEFVTNILIYLSLQDVPIISDILDNLIE